MALVAASYNVLATSYIQRNRYPNTPIAILNPAWRVPALVRHIRQLNADLLCLQEVEPETFDALQTGLGERGFSGEYARKLAGRPEGLATFFRRTHFALTDARTISAGDGAPDDTGHVTQFTVLRQGERMLGVINTHLTWDPPAAPRHRGWHQAERLLAEYRRRAAECDGWILAGDFNVTADHDIVSIVRRAGFRFAHQDLADVFTCNANGAARLVDYVFYSAGLHAEAVVPRTIDGRTVLPSEYEPSDHIALMARLDWLG